MIPETRIPGVYGEFNWKLANMSLPSNRQKVMLLGQRLGALIEPARFQGGTLNDCTSGGTFTGNSKKDFLVKISTAGTPDQFQYSVDGGASWSTATAITGSAQTLEAGVTVTFGATTGHAVGDQWEFGAWPEPSVDQQVPTQVLSDVDAAEYFGFGSIVHLMARAGLEANRYMDLNVCAMDDAAGVAAQGSITISGPATGSGSLKVYIAGTRAEVGYAKDDTAADIALALQEELVKYSDRLPVTFAVDATTAEKLNFTAKNKGTLGNQVHIGYEVKAGTGVGASVTAMSGGATDPDVQNALTAVFSEQYHIYVTAYNDQTSLETLRAHLENVAGPVEQRGGIGVYATTGSLSAATTLAGQLNAARLQGKWLYYSDATRRQYTPYEIASAYAAEKAYHTDAEGPATPLNKLEIKGAPPPAVEDRLSRTEMDTALWNGVSPLNGTWDNRVQIVRAISTYTKNSQGVDDPSQLDITKVCSADYIREAVNGMVASKYPRSKKTQRKKDELASDIFAVLKKLGEEPFSIVENVDLHKDGISVEDDATDSSRVNVKIPIDIVDGLHVIAEEFIVLNV